MKKSLLISFALVILLMGGCGAPASAPDDTPAPISPTSGPVEGEEPVQEVEPEPEPEPALTPTLPLVQNPRYIYENGAIVVGGDSEPIELINNPNAINPTYVELITFIKEDSTDEHRYADSVDVYIGVSEVPYVCSDFAEALHNSAEKAGIRAAWVSIYLEGNDNGHACNAFETTDRGLVYIDCTGGGLWSWLDFPVAKTEEGFSLKKSKPTSWDRVAYVEIGKEYGVIDIAKAGSSAYDFYEEYKRKWQEYERLVSDFDDEVMQFNQEVSEYGKLLNDYNDEVAEYNSAYNKYMENMALGDPWRKFAEVIKFQFILEHGGWGKVYREYLQEKGSTLKEWGEELEAWDIRLEEKEQVIDELAEELGDFWFEPLDIVQDIHIHWGNS